MRTLIYAILSFVFTIGTSIEIADRPDELVPQLIVLGFLNVMILFGLFLVSDSGKRENIKRNKKTFKQ